jgi:hypothetical protein
MEKDVCHLSISDSQAEMECSKFCQIFDHRMGWMRNLRGNINVCMAWTHMGKFLEPQRKSAAAREN